MFLDFSKLGIGLIHHNNIHIDNSIKSSLVFHPDSIAPVDQDQILSTHCIKNLKNLKRVQINTILTPANVIEAFYRHRSQKYSIFYKSVYGFQKHF